MSATDSVVGTGASSHDGATLSTCPWCQYCDYACDGDADHEQMLTWCHHGLSAAVSIISVIQHHGPITGISSTAH